jgi:putative FmdB family regulatory protein
MPLYEYECEQCGARFEVIQRFSDPAIDACRVCSGPVHKLISSPAIHFKGTGWYITDYARKNGSGAPAADGSTAPHAETKSDSASPKSDSASPKSDGASAAPTTSAATTASSDSGGSGKKDGA